ncbi:hypothetical protein [Sulfolobus polyhedral virus 3]|nr:hypothetical protein [Sulfolobus polyhedral virus 3]
MLTNTMCIILFSSRTFILPLLTPKNIPLITRFPTFISTFLPFSFSASLSISLILSPSLKINLLHCLMLCL